MKTCTHCGESKPLEAFGRRSPTTRKALCKDCYNAHQRAWRAKNRQDQAQKQRARYARNIEARRAAARRRYAERRKREGRAFLEDNRISHAMWRRRKGIREIRSRRQFDAVAEEESTRLPIGPFRRFLRERIEHHGSMESLAKIIGSDSRAIHRWLYESKEIQLDVIDRALTREGSSFLAELYPELYDQAAA